MAQSDSMNPSPSDIENLLRRVRTIAVVGLSPDPERPSFQVAAAMQKAGFRIVPVRPGGGTILGEPVVSSIAESGADLVDVFRAPEHVPAIVEETIAANIGAIWLQDGVIHEAAAQRAREAGLIVVMDQCIKRDGLPLIDFKASQDV